MKKVRYAVLAAFGLIAMSGQANAARVIDFNEADAGVEYGTTFGNVYRFGDLYVQVNQYINGVSTTITPSFKDGALIIPENGVLFIGSINYDPKVLFGVVGLDLDTDSDVLFGTGYLPKVTISPDNASGFQHVSFGEAWKIKYYDAFSIYKTSGEVRIDNVLLSPVPEPTNWALMIAGLGFAGSAIRLRRRAAIAAA
ncbi:PEPxxWA-CTERM sorting domain-containing protein [Sphingomonas sp.]|uniref:PEPxxWA-CTERM sorting domain-containing protein n=1 Tax=Sphingomonas sp. TaxID=28214 RepID=UPI0028AD74C1|nr:PEPxxWA-CTERM sorting domain-containing protein [Sphingomonas sp.]